MSTSDTRRATVIDGDLYVYNNMSVGGILSARVVRGRDAFQGLFRTSLALNTFRPSPLVGQWALVMIADREIESLALGEVYFCEEDGTWTDAGFQSEIAGVIEQLEGEKTARETADRALQTAINAIIAMIENGYVYAGIATPSTTPVTGKVFYIALQAGMYTNFGNTAVIQGFNIFKYNGSSWLHDALIGISDVPTYDSSGLVKSGGTFNFVMKYGSAFDISVYFATGGDLATYANLTAALTAMNDLPEAYKRGGMTIKFKDSDGNYLQYRLKTYEWSTDIDDWQSENADTVPAENSDNLISSGAVYAAIAAAIETEVTNRNEAISEKDYAVITDEEMDEVLAEGEEDEE